MKYRKNFFIIYLALSFLGLYSQRIVAGQAYPEWTPTSGEHKMLIYGQAYINDYKIDKGGYIIAAFGGDDSENSNVEDDNNIDETNCLGLSDFVPFKNEWLFYLKIESNQLNHNIYFKIFHKETGIINTLHDSIKFQRDSIQEIDIDVPFTIKKISPTKGLVN